MKFSRPKLDWKLVGKACLPLGVGHLPTAYPFAPYTSSEMSTLPIYCIPWIRDSGSMRILSGTNTVKFSWGAPTAGSSNGGKVPSQHLRVKCSRSGLRVPKNLVGVARFKMWECDGYIDILSLRIESELYGVIVGE